MIEITLRLPDETMQALRQHYARHCRQPDLTIDMWLERMLPHWIERAGTEATMAETCGPGEHVVLVRVTRRIEARYWHGSGACLSLSDWITATLEQEQDD